LRRHLDRRTALGAWMPVALGQVLEVTPQPDEGAGQETSQGDPQQAGMLSSAVLPLDGRHDKQYGAGDGKECGYEDERATGGEPAAVPDEPPPERDTLGMHGKCSPSCAVPPAVRAARGLFLLGPVLDARGSSR